ncbi:MAG TPA: zinc ribbon domain-containing protein [Treponemataceae bacterium]|nr:zinc ribbon domain-containing protein [Treponemataceae bacterium]
MPTYEYACDSCGHDFEAVQKMSDPALDTCPKCGKKIRRVFSGGIGISFKGSGFYVNDSGSSSSTSTSSGKKSSGKGKASCPSGSCPGCSGS